MEKAASASLSFILFLFLCALSISPTFSLLDPRTKCPPRCQCYEDVEQHSQSVHLICKWEQLNSTNLSSLPRPDLVRTLTIRCPHYAKTPSRPPAGLFNSLRNLDRLEIDRCLMDSIPEGLFAGLYQLYSLIIKNAKLPDIPKELFSHLPNLMTLDMTGNALRIEPYSLRSLGNLIHLDLSNNSINFMANTLVSLTKLKVLTMDNNRLTNIDFRRLPEELTDLSLRHNSINTIHYVPESARNLRRLDLSGNQMDFLSSTGSVNVLPSSLKQADLSNNKIAFIQDGSLSNIPKLTIIDLRNNSLVELKESAVLGSKTKLRIFLANNPFQCHCNIRWMMHPTEKMIETEEGEETLMSPAILDLPLVTCTHITEPNSTILVTVADQRNELMCKYANICPANCMCCEESSCHCRTSCPTGCQCFRSANVDSERTTQNVIMCENIRIDALPSIPGTTTELRLRTGDWKEWKIQKLQSLPKLKTIRISNTPLTTEEANSLSILRGLSIIDVSANKLKKLPKKLDYLSQLYLHDNPLEELTTEDTLLLDRLKKVSLGGNLTKFMCDCDSPSILQRWLREERNRQKVYDLENVTCDLAKFGRVTVVSTLPSNESLCQDETVQTTKWIDFVTTAEMDIFTTKSMMMDKKDTMTTSRKITSTASEEKLLPTDSPSTTTTRKRTTVMQRVTTPVPRYKKKYHREDTESHMIINTLIFILFICVVVLIIATAFTLYYRFNKTEPYRPKDPPESLPLNEEL